MARVETVVFNGVTFRRYPDAKKRADQVYFRPGQGDAMRGVESLHREVYKATHGPIPPGHDVHHRDHDPDNNDPSNLVALDGDEHRTYHAGQPVTEAQRAARRVNQRATAAWHASPEGRAWHVEQGRRSWEGREPRTMTCERCRVEFETLKPADDVRFCSNRCKTAARKASGVDDEDRVCEGCGATFRVDRYSTTRNCSRKCAWIVRRRSAPT